jgi:Na+-transporting NADH:ubiquinone oxidoreductase subunit A
MNAIHLKKGFSPPIAGAPSRQLRRLDDPRHVGMVPEHIPFIKPRLLVQEGDPVAIGTPFSKTSATPASVSSLPAGGR